MEKDKRRPVWDSKEKVNHNKEKVNPKSWAKQVVDREKNKPNKS